MSVKIRLKRMGSKKRPFYRIVATDSRNARDGRFIETLGYYNPLTDPADINVKEDLIFKWMERGATPTSNTESLLRRSGTMKKWALLKKGVAVEELEERTEALRASETQPLSTAARAQKAQEKADAEAKAAEVKAAAEAAEAEAKKAAEAEAKKAAEAEAEAETPEDAAPASDDSGEAKS